ncbi:hypothetical protein L596_024927 [Steinernema carpocapsae]|uniref:Uncharacterized protein n=1 Tax=Steinernema carpocapsae TaxID=34508 RepID=A0A4U5M689_STECR|nr:hypothetical protein L596_024927 [Steinernema carpocapsae]
MKTCFLVVLLLAAILVSASAFRLGSAPGLGKNAYGADDFVVADMEKLPSKRALCPNGYKPEIYFGQVVCY